MQAAENAIMAEMAEVKAGMERRQKREKRKKLEQKKKARVRAAQAVLGMPVALLNITPELWSANCRARCVYTFVLLTSSAAVYR